MDEIEENMARSKLNGPYFLYKKLQMYLSINNEYGRVEKV